MGRLMEAGTLVAWLGRTEIVQGVVTAELVSRLKATIDQVELPEKLVPLGVHWCLALTPVPGSQIGEDGHPHKGSFLPPIPLPRRMWAGGALEFYDTLRIDDVVTRKSEVIDIRQKDGRSGPLWFVAVKHEIFTPRGLAISETQDIVYRGEQAASSASASSANQDRRPASGVLRIIPDPAMLFRYSALTFNAHRIHYDRDYAVDIEHYPERVVHGPLQATLLMNLAVHLRHPPQKFSFRSTGPAYINSVLWLCAQEEGEMLILSTQDGAGGALMEAKLLTRNPI